MAMRTGLSEINGLPGRESVLPRWQTRTAHFTVCLILRFPYRKCGQTSRRIFDGNSGQHSAVLAQAILGHAGVIRIELDADRVALQLIGDESSCAGSEKWIKDRSWNHVVWN